MLRAVSRRPDRQRPSLHRSVLLRLIVVAGSLLTSIGVAAAADRYAALLQDGTRVSEADVREWNEPQAQPKIGGRNLLDAQNPARWIIDRQQPPGPPPALCVEFVGGDRLAGEVLGYRSGHDSVFETVPPHLLIKPLAELQPPDDPQPATIRVAAEWVQRVIWERAGVDEYRPSTVILRNGGEVPFRSLRWTEAGVALLTAEGIRELSAVELAEVHLPRLDPWLVYVQQLAALSPNLQSRLWQWETSDGGRITASQERFQPRHWGDRNRPESWLQLVQPAWSLDPLWLRFRTIHTWRTFPPQEPPLSLWTPASVKQESVFGHGWRWRVDRNTQQGRLTIGELEFGSGFGVHASTDLVFELPLPARELRTGCGLDAVAGLGGCINVAVLNEQSQPLFQRDLVIGSKDVVDTNWLPVPPTGDQPRRITLRVDMAQKNRPATADLFDIRDLADWVDPVVRLDPALLKTTVEQQLLGRLPGLAGWSAPPSDAATLRTANVLDNTDPRDHRFRTVVRTTDKFVVLSRPLRLATADDRWLAVMVSRFAENTTPAAVQLKVDGRSYGEFEVPVRQGPIDPEPLVIPLADVPRKTVTLEAVLYAGGDASYVDWRGAAVLPERPGVRRIYEDEEAVARALREEQPIVASTTEQPFSGTQCLQLGTGRAEAAQLLTRDALIVDAPKLGQYRFVVFAWKADGQSSVVLRLAHEGRLGQNLLDAVGGRIAAGRNRGQRLRALRDRSLDERGLKWGYAYDIGGYKPTELAPLRLDRTSPKAWRVEGRDLFGDFGYLNVTGFGLEALDGTGWFDHLYLARTPQDLEQLKTYLVPAAAPAPDATYVRRATRPEEFGPAVAAFAPDFAATTAAHGILELREHFGQAGAWQTHPNDKDKPFVLRTGLHLPADRPQVLDLRVSHAANADWVLVVQANGQKIFEQLIDEPLTRPQRGFASLKVDLAPFAGKKVLLEVLNQSNNWSNEYAYWKRVALEDK